jgi:hypothetical protein
MQPNSERTAVPPVSCLVEVALPLPVNHAWVAYACRTAGVAKPRWNSTARVWTTTAKNDGGQDEKISISNGAGPKSVRVKAERSAAHDAEHESEAETARRLVTAFVTGMQWAVRRRS